MVTVILEADVRIRHVHAIRANTATSQVQEPHDTDEVDIQIDLILIVIGLKKPIMNPTSSIYHDGRWAQPGHGVLIIVITGVARLGLAARTGNIKL